jgi:tRNA pseudouridine32 synthase/23S rRNA pseudouridine746 synthase
MRDWLVERLAEFLSVDDFLTAERFVYESGAAVVGTDEYRPHTFVWFHRDLRHEPLVPGDITVVHRDDRIVVVDKPPFLSTIPRGRHVQQSVVVRLRAELGLPELSPLHRLDRVTSGLLMCATEKRWRAPYQTLFQRGEVSKVYRAVAAVRPELRLPTTVRNHLVKRRGHMQAEFVEGEPANSESLIEFEAQLDEARAVYRLTPHSGRTHQLRMHMWSLGIPLEGDPLYPVVRDVSVDDFAHPLQLLASELSFSDPVDGRRRHFAAARSLPLLGEAL